ncbi:MAG: MaoC family dehydratase [Haliea sp.]|nr:MaoC family dehydratase [Haliea sp.]
MLSARVPDSPLAGDGGDANPVYNDREYARSRGFKDIIAQPGMNICTLVMPYRWPMKAFHKTRQLLHFEVKGTAGACRWVFSQATNVLYRPVEIGDRLSTTGRQFGDFHSSARDWARAISPNSRPVTTTSATNWSAGALPNLFSYGGKPPRGARPREQDAANAAEAAQNAWCPARWMTRHRWSRAG